MNKIELASKVAELTGLTKADSGKATDALFTAIAGALGSGVEVRVAGFGNFSVASRPARQGRNPKTGQTMPIRASKAAKFSFGKALKDSVNA